MNFDPVATDYTKQVNEVIGFLRWDHEFYLEAKISALTNCFPFLQTRSAGFRCLDLGCGTGSLLRHLSGVFPLIVGIDPSFQSLNQIPPPFRTCAAQYDGSHLPLQSDSLNFVVACCVFHHIPPADRLSVLAECRRVLQPGGFLAVIEHNPFHPLTRWVVSRCEFDRDASLLSPRLSRRLLAQAGFSRPGSHHFLFHPLNLPPWLRRLENAVLHRFPLGAQYISFASR